MSGRTYRHSWRVVRRILFSDLYVLDLSPTVFRTIFSRSFHISLLFAEVEVQSRETLRPLSTIHKSPQHPLSLFKSAVLQPFPGNGF
jgi:hypothetical protein